MLTDQSNVVIVRILRHYPVTHRLRDQARFVPLPQELERYADGVIDALWSHRGDVSQLQLSHPELSNECIELLRSYYSWCMR